MTQESAYFYSPVLLTLGNLLGPAFGLFARWNSWVTIHMENEKPQGGRWNYRAWGFQALPPESKAINE